jgi:hypothetical protein
MGDVGPPPYGEPRGETEYGRSTSLTRCTRSIIRSIFSKVERLVMLYTIRKPSPSLCISSACPLVLACVPRPSTHARLCNPASILDMRDNGGIVHTGSTDPAVRYIPPALPYPAPLGDMADRPLPTACGNSLLLSGHMTVVISLMAAWSRYPDAPSTCGSPVLLKLSSAHRHCRCTLANPSGMPHLLISPPAYTKAYIRRAQRDSAEGMYLYK